VPVDQHIRFVREVLPGRPLTMHGCLIEVGESDALVYQELRHADGQLAAAFRTRIMHIDTAGREPFPWGKSVRAAMADDMAHRPKKPRRVPSTRMRRACLLKIFPSRRRASWALPVSAWAPCRRSIWTYTDGCLQYWVIGRVSDSVPNLLFGWRKKVAAAAGDLRMGAAVLEYRIKLPRHAGSR
jgi:acyl-CoA thioester hydrolase